MARAQQRELRAPQREFSGHCGNFGQDGSILTHWRLHATPAPQYTHTHTHFLRLSLRDISPPLPALVRLSPVPALPLYVTFPSFC